MSVPESKISELIRTSLEKIKEAVDVNTVVGEPVWNEGGITVIPVSKVSVGTASGGLDRFSKNVVSSEKKNGEGEGSFGGGGGIGVTVNPARLPCDQGDRKRGIHQYRGRRPRRQPP